MQETPHRRAALLVEGLSQDPAIKSRVDEIKQSLAGNPLARAFLSAWLFDDSLLAQPSKENYGGYLLFHATNVRILAALELNPFANLLIHKIADEVNRRRHSRETRSTLQELFNAHYGYAKTDIEAAVAGDPAVESVLGIIATYPGVQLITNHRFANQLRQFGVPEIPRIFAELAATLWAAEINPGAQIGEYFFLDHTKGVVVGETAILGPWVRMYQGVTLGALSFPLNPDGTYNTAVQRHPTIEGGTRENPTILASNVDVLGAVTVGAGAKLFPGVKVTTDIPAGARVIHDFEGNVLIDGGDGNGGRVTHKELRAGSNTGK